MILTLFQPEIATNVGATIRNCACFGAGLHIIEPCGFPLKQKDIRRVGMDYGNLVDPVSHASWEKFYESPARRQGRLILLSTKADMSLYDFAFEEHDILMLGQESAGVPKEVAAATDAQLHIPLAPQARSLNVAVAGAVALAEAHRQFRGDNSGANLD